VFAGDGSGDSSGVWGYFIRIDAAYDPALQGAIATINYSEDAKYFGPLPGGDGQGTGCALLQGGTFYHIDMVITSATDWHSLHSISLTKDDFHSLNEPDDHPDFSINGSPIIFGFFRGNSTRGTTGYFRDAGIDNWSVTVNPVPLPPPVANAGPDKIICNDICDRVVLDGRQSYDLNGVIVSYEWILDHEEGTCDQETATGETPTVTGLCSGTYGVTLTVTDDDELTATDEMILRVLNKCDPCAILQGDFDSDGDVDGDDLRIFSGHFGTFTLTPE
jgi:hypothetical protein